MHTAMETVQIPGLSIPYVLVQYERLILSQDSYCVNTGIYAVRQREIDNTIFAAERNCRFCQILRQVISFAIILPLF